MRADGTVLYVNRPLGKRGEEEVIGSDLYDWIFPEQHLLVRELDMDPGDVLRVPGVLDLTASDPTRDRRRLASLNPQVTVIKPRVEALAPGRCCYVGDDLRDVQAAHAAGMRSVAVEYGYHGVGNGGPRRWGGDAVIAHPLALIAPL